MRNGNVSCILLLVLIFFAFSSRIESEDNNLLVNGDFEYRELTGWEKEVWNEGGVIESTDQKVYNGKYALKIYSGTVENDVRLIQEVPVEPDSYYRLSGWIASENVERGKVGANICIMTGFDYTGDVAGTEDWKYYEFRFKTGKNQKVIKIGVRLGMYYNIVKGTAYFDDIRLEKLNFTPRYAVILGESNETVIKNEQQKKDSSKRNQVKKIDPVLSQIDLPLILLLISIGLVPVIINAFLTIRREKKNGHIQ
ncbi:MAG: carbohydrate binding domain-containing protein [Spirochaetales bacterium]|nr:carbohydrate binding domain-containing protein [Spirochaetales bacterium]